MTLALSQGATFVAQTFAGNVNHVIEMIKEAVAHKGFSLVNVLQPCVTFNKINTYQYYLQHTYKLPPDYKKDSLNDAMIKGLEMAEEKFPLGILYQKERPFYTKELQQLESSTLLEKQRFTDFETLLGDFA